KPVMADLRKQGGTSNNGFQTVQMKDFHGPLDNEKPTNDLVDDTRKKLHYFDRDDMEFDDLAHVVEEAEHRNASIENG
ncbi:hypothetical protein Tco_0855237, partial [Tanacetum coccineum]